MPTVTHEGATIAYRVDGPPAAPALVLANSLGTTMAMWDDQIDAFAQGIDDGFDAGRGHLDQA